MRKLASIQKVLDIQPIEGADAIEVATINGWKVVVKKNEFNIGDLIIYIEVDSWVPYTLASFLSKSKEPREYNGIKGERLRTVRLRGQVSQGLILPVDTFIGAIPAVYDRNHLGHILLVSECQDVSDILNIQKYEPPVPSCLAGQTAGSFPSSIPKTDEERVQNLVNDLPELMKYEYEVTEKMEGSSCTMFLIDGEFGVCSRNINLKETEGSIFWKMARQYDVESKMRGVHRNFAIQGETLGEGIQGNHYGIKGQDFFVFAIYDITSAKYLTPIARKELCHEMGLKHVPVIQTRCPLSVIADGLGITPIEAILKYADGKSDINPQKMREGIVFKRVDGQQHFKAVSNEYLIKHG